MEIEAIQEMWGLTTETPEEFSEMVYGVKFNFMSGSPGYVGDLFILQGDTLTGDSPLILIRNKALKDEQHPKGHLMIAQ